MPHYPVSSNQKDVLRITDVEFTENKKSTNNTTIHNYFTLDSSDFSFKIFLSG